MNYKTLFQGRFLVKRKYSAFCTGRWFHCEPPVKSKKRVVFLQEEDRAR